MLFFLVLFQFANANDPIGFKSGNDFLIEPVEGWVTYYCYRDGYRSRESRLCESKRVQPQSRDRFVHSIEHNADKVNLKFINERGRVKRDSSRFSNGESRSFFNLLDSSWAMIPLLDPGVNKVEYDLMKENQVILSGNFEANVYVLESQRCRPETLTFTYDSCFDTEEVCRDYFFFNDTCR